MRWGGPVLIGAIAPALLPAAPAPAPDRMTAEEQAAVQRALDRGALLYAYDQAAWHGTDAFAARAPAALARSGGWIVDGPAESPTLVFFDRDVAAPRALFTATFRGGRLTGARLLSDAETLTLSPTRLRMIAALKAARAALARAPGVFGCAPKPFNTVVLPPTAPNGPTPVYFLTPQTETDAIPIGGHWLVNVDAAGVAAAPRAFSKSCLTMKRPPAGAARGQPAGLVVSHLLDPTPTEVHVFAALSSRLPIYVVTTTNHRVWAVEGDRIRLVGPVPGS